MRDKRTPKDVCGEAKEKRNLSRMQRQAEVCYTWNVLFFLAVETRILFIYGSTSL